MSNVRTVVLFWEKISSSVIETEIRLLVTSSFDRSRSQVSRFFIYLCLFENLECFQNLDQLISVVVFCC